MAQIKGKQLANAPDGVSAAKINADAVTTAKILDANVTTAKLAAGVLSADAAGRAKMATGLFDLATVNDKFAAGSVALAKLEEAVVQADGGQAFTADQSMGGFKLTNVAAPVAGGDAANKTYVDNLSAGLSWKDSVRAASTVDGALATAYENGDTIDGVVLATGDRILLKNQTTVSENGIYTVNASGAPTRAVDADDANELDGASVFVEEGTAAANTMWTQTGDGGTFTTNSTWVQFAATVSLTAGAGLLDTGGTWSVDLATDPALEFDAGGDAGKLRVKVLSTGGIERLSTGLAAKLDGTSIASGASGLKAAVATTANKNQTPTAGSGEFQTTGLTIAATPATASYVRVMVNGIGYFLGDGTRISVDCYFSADGGTTARAFSAIVSGDTLYWNGATAGFDLAGTDRVDMDYDRT